MGPVGAGETVKIVNNMFGGTIAALIGQGFVMGMKAGADPALMAEVIGKSSGASWQLSGAFPRNVFTGSFKPGFFTELMFKDVGLALELGKATEVPLTLAQEAYQLYQKAIDAGFAREDYTAVVKPMEQTAGVEIRTEQ